ncbi:hypothetical protein AGOR_G00204260 [Albula goreensis]|uniref:Uncharacterized protein n=1 Tax=Albula goreensis TaxID=1534307 RepID=A0A8T3CK94_9TELE|nr:hypothetical protein AGOR_G00204260 [Albula goreensis]
MCREEEEDIPSNMKEEEFGERLSVTVQIGDDVKDEEKREIKKNEQTEGDVTDPIIQTRDGKNGEKSQCKQHEEEELSTLITSCLLKQPRVLIHRCKITWRWYEPSPVREENLLTHQHRVMTWERKTRPSKQQPASSKNGILAEASVCSSVISPRNENEGQAPEQSSPKFACSQCPFVHMEEAKVHQHIENVHPEEHSKRTTSRELPFTASSGITGPQKTHTVFPFHHSR